MTIKEIISKNGFEQEFYNELMKIDGIKKALDTYKQLSEANDKLHIMPEKEYFSYMAGFIMNQGQINGVMHIGLEVEDGEPKLFYETDEERGSENILDFKRDCKNGRYNFGWTIKRLADNFVHSTNEHIKAYNKIAEGRADFPKISEIKLGNQDIRKEFSYYEQVCTNALVAWNGKTEEEAINIVRDAKGDYDKLNELTYGSLDSYKAFLAAWTGYKIDALDNEKIKDIEYEIGGDHPLFKEAYANLPNEQILKGLEAIHDNWTTHNLNDKTFDKKLSQEKGRQYVPANIIGWPEVKNDLVFCEPILKDLNWDEKGVEKLYHDNAKMPENIEKTIIDYCKDHGREINNCEASIIKDQLMNYLDENDPQMAQKIFPASEQEQSQKK